MGRQPPHFERATRRLFTRIMTAIAHTLAENELSVAQLAALHLVDDRGAMNSSALAEELRLSPSGTSRLVDDLVRRGWLSRTEDPADRRMKRLALTPEGARFLAQLGEGRTRVIFDTIERYLPKVVFAALSKAMERALADDRF